MTARGLAMIDAANRAISASRAAPPEYSRPTIVFGAVTGKVAIVTGGVLWKPMLEEFGKVMARGGSGVVISSQSGVSLDFEFFKTRVEPILLAKRPGPALNMANIELGFAYKDFFEMQPSTGYETLIYDCLTGDGTLFQRADNIENGWRAVQPFLDAWKKAGGKGLKVYEPGSEGPEEDNDLLERDGRSWRKLG